jgi:hypothetical protein
MEAPEPPLDPPLPVGLLSALETEVAMPTTREKESSKRDNFTKAWGA